MKKILIAISSIILLGAGCSSATPNSNNTGNPTTVQKTEKKLEMKNQKLTKVPSYIFQLSETTELDLSNNDLTGALPAEVRHLKKLRKLNLSNNKFTGVPAEVGQLTELIELDISGNNITGLPLEIGNLKKLQIFNISGNNVSKIDLDQIVSNIPNVKIIQN